MAGATFDPGLGTALTAVGIAPVTIGAAGALTTGTRVNLEALIGGLENTFRSINEDIRPLWDPNINEVPIASGDEPRLIVMKNSLSADVASQAIRNNAPVNGGSGRFLIDWTFGKMSFSCYGTYREVRDGFTERGENTQEIQFGPMSPGGALKQMTVVVNP